jgi:hypothetical protein
MTIRLVDPAEAVRDWIGLYEPQIARVIERADSPHYPDDILTCVQKGTMQLWRTVNGDGIGVTELQTYPRYKQLLVYMVAGENAQDWLTGAHQQLVAFALSQRCTRMEFHGRPGWAKWCRAFGYEHTSIRMKVEIGDGRRRPVTE